MSDVFESRLSHKLAAIIAPLSFRSLPERSLRKRIVCHLTHKRKEHTALSTDFLKKIMKRISLESTNLSDVDTEETINKSKYFSKQYAIRAGEKFSKV